MGTWQTTFPPDQLLCKQIKMGGGQKLGFAENFMLSGVAAAVSKTAAAPIERVKLLVQNQSEMLKQGILDKPYSGVVDCTTRTMKTEGLTSVWWCCWIPFAHIRLLARLLPYQVGQRRQVQVRHPAVQRHGRRVRQDHQVRRYPGSVPWLRHLMRRYLHLPWHVLRSVRLHQAHRVGRQRFSLPVLHPGLDCDRHRRPHVLPHRHHPSAYDDDLRTGRQVQGIHGLRCPDPQERRIHVNDEGCWCQHSSWCGWCRCPRRIRQVQGALHPVEIGLNMLLSIHNQFTKHQTKVIIQMKLQRSFECAKGG